jgi:hypothetical protein
VDDTLTCPICAHKLRNVKRTSPLYVVGKLADYTERTCTKGPNHRGLQFFVDQDTHQVDLLKLPLNSEYTQYLEIDFLNQRCRILCMTDGKLQSIILEKLLIPDFPTLEKLKEKIAIYLTFS